MKVLNGVQFNINQEINQQIISNAIILLISNCFDKVKEEEINNQIFIKSLLKICTKNRISVVLIQNKIKINQELIVELSKINVLCV